MAKSDHIPLSRTIELAHLAHRLANVDGSTNAEEFADDLEQRFGSLLQLELSRMRERHRINEIPMIERALALLIARGL